ncbi:hypothetical protein [Hymenobacter sp.]|jgi:hypothetical protein|uniref:hypothetical protein n=1 Tax=Hymenobacter sp. TaxID=1898978 RepID=UPI002ED94189
MNQNFQAVSANMDPLHEGQEGKLRGGFAAADSIIDDEVAVNDYCQNNKCTGTGGENYRCSNTGCN